MRTWVYLLYYSPVILCFAGENVEELAAYVLTRRLNYIVSTIVINAPVQPAAPVKHAPPLKPSYSSQKIIEENYKRDYKNTRDHEPCVQSTACPIAETDELIDLTGDGEDHTL